MDGSIFVGKHSGDARRPVVRSAHRLKGDQRRFTLGGVVSHTQRVKQFGAAADIAPDGKPQHVEHVPQSPGLVLSGDPSGTRTYSAHTAAVTATGSTEPPSFAVARDGRHVRHHGGVGEDPRARCERRPSLRFLSGTRFLVQLKKLKAADMHITTKEFSGRPNWGGAKSGTFNWDCSKLST